MQNLDAITAEAVQLAKAVSHHVFVFSAGPIANALIPLMNRANPFK